MATVTVCIYYWWLAPWPCVCSGGMELQRNQVIYCTMEKVPEAQLTHPTNIIALLLHFFHYCYHLLFQYPWLGVTVPKEFTLWPYGESLLTNTPVLLHTHRCPTVPLSPPKLNGLLSFSILIIFSSHLTRRAIICFGNASLRGVICWSRNVLVQTFKQCFTLG